MREINIKTTNISLTALSKAENEEINNFLVSSKDATIFHTIGWNRILSEIFSDKKEEFRIILAEKDREIVGFYPIVVKKQLALMKNLFSPVSSYGTPYGGPIFNRNKEVLKSLVAESEKKLLIQKFDIFTSPGLDCIYFSKFGYNVEKAETVVLELDRKEEELWKNFNRSTKRNINKAEKNDVEIVEFERPDINAVNSYYSMIKSTLGEKAKRKKYYLKVVFNLLPKNNAKILLAKHDDKYIAGSIILSFKDVIYYWHGASFREFLNLAPNHLLQWHIIKWANANGYKKYDFVRIERDRLPGIARFKLGWGGEIVSFYRLRKEKSLYKMGRSLKNLVYPNKR